MELAAEFSRNILAGILEFSGDARDLKQNLGILQKSSGGNFGIFQNSRSMLSA